MGLFGKGNELFGYHRRKKYPALDVYDGANEPFQRKLGLFERLKNMFSDDKERSKEKLEKVLQEICDQVNTIPRGYGKLPENKNISMNGYFNIRYADSLNPEYMSTSGTMLSGNDQETNMRLYAQALQVIDDLVYERRLEIARLCQKEPELSEMVDKTVATLKRREEYYNILRVEGYQKELAWEVKQLDMQFGAMLGDHDPRYNEMAKSGIDKYLTEAEKKLGQSRNKEKQKLSETMEELKLYLAEQDLSIVPREEFKKYELKKNQEQPFTARLEDFIERHTPLEDKSTESLINPSTLQTTENSRESLELHTRRALANNRSEKGVAGETQLKETNHKKKEINRTL